MKSTGAYWWEAAPLSPTAAAPVPVAPASDVVVVGAGYTGLSAAITLARAGRSVQVFDRQKPGEGASSRNGGITSGNIRPGYAELIRRFGQARADAITAEAKVAREDLYRFIADENIDCDFRLVGRFAGAVTPEGYDTLAREAERLEKSLGIESYAVPRGEQRQYLGTDFYRGGAVRMDIGGLHPAKLHAEMLRIARQAGAVIHGETAVLGVRQDGGEYAVTTARGAGAQPHHRHRADLRQPDGCADAAAYDAERRTQAALLLPPVARRHARAVRRPRRHHRRRCRLADQGAARRDGWHPAGAEGCRDHA
jgi:glycerol-3-phosphate dehydrogenase